MLTNKFVRYFINLLSITSIGVILFLVSNYIIKTHFTSILNKSNYYSVNNPINIYLLLVLVISSIAILIYILIADKLNIKLIYKCFLSATVFLVIILTISLFTYKVNLNNLIVVRNLTSIFLLGFLVPLIDKKVKKYILRKNN